MRANPHLLLHDFQSVWLDLEVLDLLKNVTQEKRQLVIIPPNGKVRPKRMMCIVVRKSRQIGVIRELGQGVTDEVRKEPGYYTLKLAGCPRAQKCTYLVITDVFGEAFASGLVTY